MRLPNMQMPLKIRPWVLAFLIGFVPVLGSCMFWETERLPELPALVDPPEIVHTLIQPEIRDIRRTMNRLVSIIPQAQRVLYFTRAGRVADIYVKPGEWVEKHQPIMALHRGDLEFRRTQLALDVERQEILFQQAQWSVENHIISPLEFRLAQIDYEKIQNELAHLDMQLAEHVLLAPHSGVIDFIAVKEDDLVQAFGATGVISDPRELRLILPFRAGLLTDIQAARGVELTFENRIYTGRLQQVANPQVTPAPDQVFFEIVPQVDQIDQTDQTDQTDQIARWSDLIPISRSLSLYANLILEEKFQVLGIDKNAVKTYFGTSYVRIFDGNTYRDVEVQTGIDDGQWIEIISGIDLDSRVVLW